MTNKVAFMNENDNDYHLDLQVKSKKNLIIFNYKYKRILKMKDRVYLLPLIAKYTPSKNKKICSLINNFFVINQSE